MNTLIKISAALLMSATLVACGGDSDLPSPEPDPTPRPQSVVQVAEAAGNFTTLITALEATGLDATLGALDETFTVFAPTDAAFELLGQDTITALLADTDTLSDILLYHVLSGAEVDAAGAIAAAGTAIATANDDSIGLSLDGDSLYVNLSLVTTTDIMADNGIIHVIDAVLMPPADPGTPTMNIVDTAVAAGSFTTLVQALGATGLDAALADPDGMFTVFAPTDAAFEALGADNVAALIADTDALEDILLQHVVGASVDKVNALTLNGATANTLGGAEIPVSITPDRELRFGGAEVETTNIYTTNGIIHVIDTVVIADEGLPKPMENIAEVATAAGSFSTLLEALTLTGLDATLTSDGAFTVFAPTDAAFDGIDINAIDVDTLTDILLYHVISGAEVLADGATAVAASASQSVTMANMDSASLSLGSEDGLVINTSEISAANVMASNGVIHVIDTVMMPPAEMGTPTDNIVETAIANGNFTTLISALQSAGLDDALADESQTFTVFAPTDAAFDLVDDGVLAAIAGDMDALTALLQQHVIAGAAVDSVSAFALNGREATTLSGANIGIEVKDGYLEVGGSRVSMFDVYTSNGVIHVIDAVIVGDLELPEPLESIVDVAAEAGNFTTLLAALEEAELDDDLGDFNEVFTVFAPTDAAFELLGEDAIAALLADADALSDVLLYHVVPEARVDAATAIGMAGMTVDMANGDKVGLSLSGDSLLVNLSTVTVTDIQAANGIIHVIDAVLMPPAEVGMPDMNIIEVAQAQGNFSTLLTALGAAGLTSTLENEDEQFTVFAPTDAAFDLIDSATLDALIADVPALTDVLLQHVIIGATVDSVTAFSLNGTSTNTAADEDVTIDIVEGVLEIQGSAVSVVDVYTNNGVIHVIDAVITETLQ